DLAAAAQPQVAMFEQEGGAVLLWRDGEVVARSDDLQVRGGELDAAGRARVGPHGARDLDGGLLGELRERLPRGVANVLLGEDHLQIAGGRRSRRDRKST